MNHIADQFVGKSNNSDIHEDQKQLPNILFSSPIKYTHNKLHFTFNLYLDDSPTEINNYRMKVKFVRFRINPYQRIPYDNC